jgi:hypothetical protein
MAATSSSAKFSVSERQRWKDALASGRPVLVHLNADTTWLVQLPYPSSAKSTTRRSHFNVLLDPWLQGTQSDYVSWFSTQWHVVAPVYETVHDLEKALAEVDDGRATHEHQDWQPHDEAERQRSSIDAVVVSHEFTDHCHRKTLSELTVHLPVFATEKAATIIRSWKHFDRVETIPTITAPENGVATWLNNPLGSLPAWIRLGRSTTSRDAGRLHSAVVLAFGESDIAQSGCRGVEAIVYSPHGIKAESLQPMIDSKVSTLALLHGLSDIRLGVAAQLNLGALNAVRTARKTSAKHWIATHDEPKAAKGLVSWVLRRKTYSLGDAVSAIEAKEDAEPPATGGATAPSYRFTELGSGDAIVLDP